MSPYGDCEVVQSKVRSSSANSNVFMYACTYVRTNVCLYVGERQRDRETESQRDRETERQRDRETGRQRDRETERQREKERSMRMACSDAYQYRKLWYMNACCSYS